jgi:hypothetical protein
LLGEEMFKVLNTPDRIIQTYQMETVLPLILVVVETFREIPHNMNSSITGAP